jgi:hypothetical protein
MAAAGGEVRGRLSRVVGRRRRLVLCIVPVHLLPPLRLRESLTFVTLPETTVTGNKSYRYLHCVRGKLYPFEIIY